MNARYRELSVMALLSLSAGALGGYLAGHGSAEPSVRVAGPGESGESLFRVVDAVSDLLDREVEERLRLEEELAELRRRIAPPPAAPTPAREREPEGGFEPDPTPSGGGTRGDARVAGFLEAGFGETDAAWFARLSEDTIAARFRLRDRAEREGWLDTARYRDALAKLPGSLSELSKTMDEDTFSRYLYAVGRPNQVRVNEVLAGSAAQTAGVEPGDVLLRYGDARLYSAGGLRQLTRSGDGGTMVAVEIRRDDQVIQTWLPRGFMGVAISSERALPPG